MMFRRAIVAIENGQQCVYVEKIEEEFFCA